MAEFVPGMGGTQQGAARTPFAESTEGHVAAPVGDASLNRLALESSDHFQKVLEEAANILNPIFERIAGLPANERESLVSSHSGMEGPAYDAMRNRFAC